MGLGIGANLPRQRLRWPPRHRSMPGSAVPPHATVARCGESAALRARRLRSQRPERLRRSRRRSLRACSEVLAMQLANALPHKVGVRSSSLDPRPPSVQPWSHHRRRDYVCRLGIEEFVVRACRPEDVSAVLELWRQGRSEHATTTDRLGDVQQLLSNTPGSLLVADADGAILGALIAAWDGWRGNMYRLVVRVEDRRRGIGLALVRAGEDHLRRQGASRVTALVAYEDELAAAFWEAAGYPRDRQIGRRVRNL